MKIEVIKEENNVFDVKYTPNRFQRLLGRKERVEQYKRRMNYKYVFCDAGKGVFFKSDGKILSFSSKEVELMLVWEYRW